MTDTKHYHCPNCGATKFNWTVTQVESGYVIADPNASAESGSVVSNRNADQRRPDPTSVDSVIELAPDGVTCNQCQKPSGLSELTDTDTTSGENSTQ